MVKTHLPEQISGSRVALRKHGPDLADLMYSYVDRDRERLGRFLPWVEFTRSLEDELAYISHATFKWDAYEMYDYGLFEKSTGHYLGNIGVHTISWDDRRAEIGYWILGEFEGRGFMSEALALLENACFEAGFHRLEIRCSSENVRSARLPKRAGYVLEACLRENLSHPVRREDTLVFAKLRGQSAGGGGLIGIESAYMFCGHFAAAKAWYAKVLGVPPVREFPGYAEFRPGGLSGLVICELRADAPKANLRGHTYWRTLDLDQSLRHFEAHGGSRLGSPVEIGPGVRLCELMDPFGNVLGLVQDPI